jgi:hypothetical protein
MKTGYILCLCICLVSCLTKTGTEKPDLITEKKEQTNDTVIKTINTARRLPQVKEIRQLNEDTCSISWYGGGLFSLCFERNKVNFFFTAQCLYWYKTKLEKDKLIFFWSYNEDCVFDRGLKRNYGVTKPAVGTPFGEFALLNDTTLKVKYYYPNWVKKVNEQATDVDTLFPTIFKMKTK